MPQPRLRMMVENGGWRCRLRMLVEDGGGWLLRMVVEDGGKHIKILKRLNTLGDL